MQTLTAIEIQSMVRNMDDSKKKYKYLKERNFEEYQAKVEAENKVLADDYYSIFKMHIRDELDATFFYMLDQKRRIENGEITDDQAAIEVGKKLAERYIDPVVNNIEKPKVMSYSEYYKNSK